MYELLLTDEPPGSNDTSTSSDIGAQTSVPLKQRSMANSEPTNVSLQEPISAPAPSNGPTSHKASPRTSDKDHGIRFGDSIMLQRYNQNVFFVRSTGTEGFGISFVELQSECSGLDTVIQQPVPFPPDLGNAVFVILPNAKYTNAAKLAKVKEAALLRDQSDLDDEDPLVTFLKDSVESEVTINGIETKQNMGFPVRYGDECRLQHQATGEFLSSHTFDGDDTGMPMLLKKDAPDSSVTFVVDPEFKSDLIGDLLWSSQPFSFKSAESRLKIGIIEDLVQRDGSENAPYVLGHYRSVMQSQGCLLTAQVFQEYSKVDMECTDDREASKVMGGTLLRLFHCEHQDYLGCLDDEATSYDLTNVGLIADDDVDSESYDMRSLWRVDYLLDKGLQGAALTEEKKVSLRHYVTGRYLCKGNDNSLSVTSNYLAHGAQWKFDKHLGLLTDEYIRFGHSHILLKNTDGQATIVVSKEREVYCAHAEDAAAKCIQSNIFHLQMFDSDKLSMMRNSESALSRAKELLSTIKAAAASGAVAASASGDVGAEEAAIVEALAKYAEDIIECYSEMVIACTEDVEQDAFIRDGLPNIGAQRVLAQLGAIELTIEFIDTLLQDPPSAIDDDPGKGAAYASIKDHESNKAITLLFRFLRQIVKANNVRSHVHLLERHTEFMYKHLNSDFKVVDTISELIADNNKMLSETVNPEFTSHIADTLCTQHEEKLCGARFVNMLRIMCSLDGEPMVYNQSVVLTHAVIQMMEREENPFPQVKISKDGLVQISCNKKKKEGKVGKGKGRYSSKRVDWIHLSEFQARGTKHEGVYEKYLMEKPLRDCTDREKILRMHVETIKLFSALVQGRNILNVEFLLTHADFFGLKYDLLLAAIENPRLPKFYRRYLIQIVHHIFIDCEPYARIKFKAVTLVPQSSVKTAEIESSTHVNNRFFNFSESRPTDNHARLKGILIRTLNSVGCFKTHNYDGNLLLASCLDTLNLLLQFGMCTNEGAQDGDAGGSLSDLIEVLIQLLDTQNEEYFHYDIFTAPIVQAKLIIMEMLFSVTDLQVSAHLRFVYDFFNTQLAQQTCTSDMEEFSYDKAQLKKLFKSIFTGPILHTNIVLTPNDVQPNQDIWKDGKWLRKESAKPDGFTHKLLQLTRYENMEMQSCAFSMLFRHRGQKEALVIAMKKACLVVHPDLVVADLHLQAEVKNLRPQIKWLAYPASPDRATAVNFCSKAMPRWIEMCTAGYHINLGGKKLKVDEFFSQKLAGSLFAHDAHILAIEILKLDINLIDLTSLQLRGLVEECDLDNNGVFDTEELEQCCGKLRKWVLGDEADEGDFDMCSTSISGVEGGDASISAVQDWLSRFFREAYQTQLSILWDHCFELLGAMCIAGPDIQIEIAKLMSITDTASSELLNKHLQNPPPALSAFISQVAKENSTVCNNFDEEAFRKLCADMLESKNPKSALVLSDLCRANGIPCERNVAILVDCLVGHTDSMAFRVNRGKDGRHEIDADLEWQRACILLLAAIVEGTNPRELVFVQTLVDFEMCVAGICLPFLTCEDRIEGVVKEEKVRKSITKRKSKASELEVEDKVKFYRRKTSELVASDEEILQNLFDRYDLNCNGAIDDYQELLQLTTNGATKFRARLTGEKIEELCSSVDISEPWSFERYSAWFTAMVLVPNDDPIGTNNPMIELLVKGDTVEEPSEFDGDSTSTKYTLDSNAKETLLLKGAYLILWTQCFANVTEDVTMRMMGSYSECSPPMASIFPKGFKHVEMDAGVESSVMDSIYQVLTALVQTPDLLQDKEVVATVYDSIVPCLQVYTTMHLSDLLPHNQRKIIEVLKALKTFSECAEKQALISQDEIAAIRKVSTCVANIIGSSDASIADLMDGMDHTEGSDEGQKGKDEIVEAMWEKFIEQCAKDLGLKTDEDDVTMIGDSIKSIANMLCADEIHTPDCKCTDKDKCNHKLSCRHIIYNMFDALAHSGSSDVMDESLIRNLLTMARAMIYIDRSEGEEFEENWNHFVDGEEIGKDECMHIREWTQWSLAELGATDVLIVLAGSEDPEVQMATIRLGIALLEGGNTLVQDQLLNALTKCPPIQAAKFITCVCRELNEAKGELALIMTRSSVKEADGSVKEMEECDEAFKALRFWQALAEGHHLGFQEFIGGTKFGVDVFAELEEILQMTTATVMRFEHETVIDLLNAIFDVYQELVEGPCNDNQARLTGSEAIANVTNLLFNIGRLDSNHVPHYVDSLRCNPPGTFKPPKQTAHDELSPETVLDIKEGIYGLFKSLLDGSEKVVAKSLAMHLSPLCLLRDIFAVEPIMLYRTKLDLGENQPACVRSMMRSYQKAQRRFYNIVYQSSDFEIEEAEERERSFDTAADDPNLLRLVSLAKDAFIVLKYLEAVEPEGPYGECFSLMRSGNEPLWTKYYNILETRISTVEITLDHDPTTNLDDVTYTYNFNIPDICHHLRAFSSWTNHVKDQMDLIPRDNAEHKQLEFVKCLNCRLIEVDHLNDLLETVEFGRWGSALLTFLVNQQDFIDAAPFILAAIITTVLCLTYGYDKYSALDEGGHERYKGYPGAEVAVICLGFLCAFSSFILVIKHFVVIVPYQVDLWVKAKKKAAGAFISLKGLKLHQTLHGRAAPEFLPGQKPYQQNLDTKQFHAHANNSVLEEVDFKTRIKWALTDGGCWYFTCLFSLSLVAFCLHGKGKFMFALVMLDYMRRPDGQMIMASVIEGAPGLMGSARVAIVLIMNYACISWWLFADEIQTYNDCKTAYQCVMKAIEAGLQGDMAGLHGSDYGDLFTQFPLGIDDMSKKQVQWWFVQTYFVMWNYIIAGIVQGYIVDAFGAIRGAQDDQSSDAKGKCLVCSLEKFDLEAAGVPFVLHTESQHNRWAYLYVATAVKIKPPDEHGTAESVVYAGLLEGSTKFLPIETCVHMEQKKAVEIDAEIAREIADESPPVDRLTAIEGNLAVCLGRQDQVQNRLTTIENNLGACLGNLALLLERLPAVDD